MANDTVVKTSQKGCLVDEATFRQLVKDVCDLKDAIATQNTAEILFASNTPTGLRVANTNLSTTTWQTGNINIVNLTNTNSVPAVVDVDLHFPTLYQWHADARIVGYADYTILVNGSQVESRTSVRYNWDDNRGHTGNPTLELEMNATGSNSNYTKIVLQPSDVITVQQSMRIWVIGDGSGTERVYVYNGQSRVMAIPETVLVP